MNTVPANFANPACEVCGKYFANSADSGGIDEVRGSRENWVKICAQMLFSKGTFIALFFSSHL